MCDKSVFRKVIDLEEAKALLDQMRKNRRITTGFESMDNVMGGLIPGGVTLIAGRPAMGRSSLVLNMVSRLSKQLSGSILIFSPRYNEREITFRLLTIGTGLPARKFFDKTMPTEDLLGKCVDFFASNRSKIQINSSSAPSLEDIRRCCKRTPDIKLLIVDSIERICEPFELHQNDQHWDEIYEPNDKILQFLKVLALDLDIPIICTTCLHRSLERRNNKRPHLGDFKKIDLPIDLVDQIIFLYRDRYYYYDSPEETRAECIVARNNGGEVGTAWLSWDWDTACFSDIPK